MKTGPSTITHLLLGTLLMLATLSGCAAIDQKIAMNYAPVDGALGRQEGTIVVSRIDSVPAVRNGRGEWIVGSLNNVHGVHGADLLADRNQGEWVTEALLLELKHAGYRATYQSPLPPATPFGIQLGNIRAFTDVNRGIFSSEIRQELKFNVELYRNGALIKSFAVASRTRQTVPLSASAGECDTIMLRALQDAMQQVMAEVRPQTAIK